MAKSIDPYSYTERSEKAPLHFFSGLLQSKYKLILCITAVSIMLSIFFAITQKLNYVAVTKVNITTVGEQINNNTELRAKTLDIASEIEIIKSPELIEALISDQALYKDTDLGGFTDIQNFHDLNPRDQARIIKKTTRNLKVEHDPNGSIVSIFYRHPDPVRAADVANAIVRVYTVREHLKTKSQSQTALDQLAHQLDVLKQDVQLTEKKLADTKEEYNLFEIGNADTRVKEIESLSEQLTAVELALLETYAEMKKIDEAFDKGDFITDPRFTDATAFENMRAIEDELAAEIKSYEGKYSNEHPRIIALHKEMVEIKQLAIRAMADYAESLDSKRIIELSEIQQIKDQITKLQNSYDNDVEKRVLLENLMTQADTSRELLANLRKTYLETIKTYNDSKRQIRIISKAVPPLEPHKINIMLIIFLGALAGLIFSTIAILVTNKLRNVVYDPTQLEKLTGLPVFGLLPKVKLDKDDTAVSYILKNPSSPLAESIRSLYTTLQLRDPFKKSGARVITITSTGEGEGKTASAVWFANIAAQNGKKVLIIDANLRDPALHKVYNIGNAKGVADYLSDRLPLEDTIYKKHTTGVHLMTGKAIPTHALILLTVDKIEAMMRKLRDTYDIIIFDTPETNLFSDSRILARLSDKVFYIVEWKKTKSESVKECVKQFSDMKYNELAFVLNKVNNN